MLSIVKSSYGLILFALLFSGVELFVWFYLGEVGLLASLIEQDQSRVSALIIAIYVLATLHFLFACYSTSQQFIDIGLSPAQDSRSQVLKQFFQRVDQIGKDQHKLCFWIYTGGPHAETGYTRDSYRIYHYVRFTD